MKFELDNAVSVQITHDNLGLIRKEFSESVMGLRKDETALYTVNE